MSDLSWQRVTMHALNTQDFAHVQNSSHLFKYTLLGIIISTAKRILKSEVAIASLLRQTKQTKKILLQVKAITKSPGLLSLSNIKKAEFSGFKA